MSLVIPHTFTGGPGNKAKAIEVNANFAAVAAKFTTGAGGISAADIAIGAGIKGSGASNQLSTTPGERVSTTTLEDDAVDARVLKDDATGTPGVNGSPNAAVNTASHIKDRIITGYKMVLATISKAEMKVTVSSHTCTLGDLAAATTRIVQASQFTPNLPLPADAIILGCWIEGATSPATMIVKPYKDTGANVYRVGYSHSVDSGNQNFNGVVINVAWLNLT